ncbi:MAG: hypothetical protein IKK20_04435, partial [Clostridia bacterium]|nr:hypothetical protein [Clostridia bacterium]
GAATLSSGALSGYTYFTMGSYDNDGDGVKDSINWVIIGRNSNDLVGFDTLAWYVSSSSSYGVTSSINDTINDTPVGLALLNDDVLWDWIVGGVSLQFSTLEASSEIIDNELAPGEILVISEKIICDMAFGSGTYFNYEISELKTQMKSFFDTEFGFSENQKRLIVPQELKNTYGQLTSYTSNAYLFPLAVRGENFNAGTYLASDELISYTLGTTNVGSWWTRSGWSGDKGYIINGSGATNYGHHTVSSYSYGVRPAMVLKLT